MTRLQVACARVAPGLLGVALGFSLSFALALIDVDLLAAPALVLIAAIWNTGPRENVRPLLGPKHARGPENIPTKPCAPRARSVS